MAIPSAVRKQGEESERLATESGMKGAPNAPEAVQQPAQPAAPQPAPQPSNENWEERYKSLRTKRDERVDALEKRNEELQGMVTDSQRQINELLGRLDQASRTPEKQPSPEDRNEEAYQAWLKKVPKRFTDEYEESWLRDQFELAQTMMPTAKGPDPELVKRLEAAEQELSTTKQERVKSARERYNEAMDEAFPNDEWVTMTNSGAQEWVDFCARTSSPADPRTYGEILMQAHESCNSDVARWVLNTYKQQGRQGGNPLDEMITPDGAAGNQGADVYANVETFTLSQVNQIFKDIATSKKYTKEQAADLESRISKAQQAGKIIPG